MLNTDNRIPFFLLYTPIGIVIGIFLTVFVKKYSTFTISNVITLSINPLEVISILITVALAIYITRILDRKNSVDSKEQNLMIDFFDNYYKDVLSRVKELIKDNSCSLIRINSDCKFIRKRLYLVKNVHPQVEFLESHEHFNRLEEKINELWKVLTYTPRKKSKLQSNTPINTPPARVFSQLEIQQIENILIEIESIIMKLIFTINRKY